MNPVFADLPVSVFEAMSRLAREHEAINLGQGFPDDQGPEDVRRKAADDARRLKEAEQEARRLAEQRAAEEARRAEDEAKQRRLVSPGEDVERGEDLPPIDGGQLNFDGLPGVN